MLYIDAVFAKASIQASPLIVTHNNAKVNKLKKEMENPCDSVDTSPNRMIEITLPILVD